MKNYILYMPYKNYEDHKRYQRERYQRIRRGENPRLTTSLTDEERKERKKEYAKKYKKNLKLRVERVFGCECFICGKNNKRRILHKKDGKIHYKDTLSTKREALKSPEEFVQLCYGCHKAVHWCMNILKWNWDKIISELEVVEGTDPSP